MITWWIAASLAVSGIAPGVAWGRQDRSSPHARNDTEIADLTERLRIVTAAHLGVYRSRPPTP